MTPASKPRRQPKAAAASKAGSAPKTGSASKAAGQPRDERVADDAAVLALIDALSEGVAGLPEALDVAEQSRRARAEAARELLGSRELKAAARQAPQLAKSITSARKELDNEDAAAEQTIAELRDASGEWQEALKLLREPRQ